MSAQPVLSQAEAEAIVAELAGLGLGRLQAGERSPAASVVTFEPDGSLEQGVKGRGYRGVCLLNPTGTPVRVGLDGGARRSPLVVPAFSGLVWPQHYDEVQLAIDHAPAEGISVMLLRLPTAPHQPAVFDYEAQRQGWGPTRMSQSTSFISGKSGVLIRPIAVVFSLITSAIAGERVVTLEASELSLDWQVQPASKENIYAWRLDGPATSSPLEGAEIFEGLKAENLISRPLPELAIPDGMFLAVKIEKEQAGDADSYGGILYQERPE